MGFHIAMKQLNAVFAAILSLGYPGMISGAMLDFTRDIGIAAASAQQQLCMASKNKNLRPGQPVKLAWIPDRSSAQAPEIKSAIVGKLLTAPCNPVNSAQGEAAYSLNGANLDTDKIYVAVVGQVIDLRLVAGKVRGKIGARQEITFRSCSSLEGIHFSAWTGGVPKEKRVWHAYYYLGYDVEPTCTDPELKD
jgi:hypothetical protein